MLATMIPTSYFYHTQEYLTLWMQTIYFCLCQIDLDLQKYKYKHKKNDFITNTVKQSCSISLKILNLSHIE